MALIDDVKNKVQRILVDDLGKVEIDRDGDFVVRYESAVTFIQVNSRELRENETQIVVRAFCPLIENVKVTPALYEWVATAGQDFLFGGCQVLLDDDGKTCRVDFGDTILANDLDPNELLNLVFCVVFTSNELDNMLQK